MNIRTFSTLLAAIGLATVAFGAGAYAVLISQDRPSDFPSYAQEEIQSPTVPGMAAKPIIQNRRPCLRSYGREENELCAQWRAVRAAEDSAYWGWLASIMASLGTFATLVAIFLTYAANKIARDTAQSQLRPYVFISKTRLYDVDGVLFIGCETKNYGLTPAIDVEVKFNFLVGPTGSVIADADMRTFIKSGIIAPSALSSIDRKVEILNADRIAAIRRGEMAVYLRYSISYTWAGAEGQRDGFDQAQICEEPYLDRGLFRTVAH